MTIKYFWEVQIFEYLCEIIPLNCFLLVGLLTQYLPLSTVPTHLDMASCSTGESPLCVCQSLQKWDRCDHLLLHTNNAYVWTPLLHHSSVSTGTSWTMGTDHLRQKHTIRISLRIRSHFVTMKMHSADIRKQPYKYLDQRCRVGSNIINLLTETKELKELKEPN